MVRIPWENGCPGLDPGSPGKIPQFTFSIALGGQGMDPEVVSVMCNEEFNFCCILVQYTLN